MTISIQQTKSKRLTPQLLNELGAIKIFESNVFTEVWQIGLLQYGMHRDTHPKKFQLWHEPSCSFVEEAKPIQFLHELLIQYYGLTFKNLTNG